MPGPHGFAVRDPSSPRGFARLCTPAEALVKTEAASFVCAPLIAHRPFANLPCHLIARPTLPRPPHPCPTSVTIAIRPSEGRDGGSCKSDLGSPVPFAKIFQFSHPPNHIYNFRHPVPQEGRIAIVTDVGHGMRWTRQLLAREGIAGRVLMSL